MRPVKWGALSLVLLQNRMHLLLFLLDELRPDLYVLLSALELLLANSALSALVSLIVSHALWSYGF